MTKSLTRAEFVRTFYGRSLSRRFGFANLITPDGYSPKTDKGHARNVATAILYLAPADASGVANLCTYASLGCKHACLYRAGRGGFDPAVPAARVNRTKWLKFHRELFNAQLIKETIAHRAKAARRGMQCAARLNGTSDIPWENKVVDADGHTMMTLFPDVQFYDYTKDVRRALKHARGDMPANYHITFSRSETNESDCRAVLAAGGSVAVVFKICECNRPCKHEVPDDTYTYMGYPVVSGDHDDLRFMDAPNVVVGLKAKGPAKHDTSGFVVNIAECGRTPPELTDSAYPWAFGRVGTGIAGWAHTRREAKAIIDRTLDDPVVACPECGCPLGLHGPDGCECTDSAGHPDTLEYVDDDAFCKCGLGRAQSDPG